MFLTEFRKIFKNEDFGLKLLEKGNILRDFSGIAPTEMKILSENLRVEYVYIYTNILILYILFIFFSYIVLNLFHSNLIILLCTINPPKIM